MDFSIFSSFLPQGLLTHFDIVDFKELGDLQTKNDCFYIYLDEKNILPKDFKNAEFESKGFYERTIIQDFPIRGKAVYLGIRRRRWRNKFTNVIESYKIITRSMSRKGNCWDNAVAESFFKTLKTEQIYGNKLISKKQMERDIFEFIEIWYNRKRRHSALDYKTIEEFWKQKNNFKNVA